MSHDHSHEHSTNNFGKAFLLGVFLNFSFVILEVTIGLLSNSLALVADAGHNLSDVLSLCISWGANVASKRPPSERHTYGLRRSSILAALFNAVLLLFVLGGMTWEAIIRFRHPVAVPGMTVIMVGGCGIVINVATAFLFSSGRKTDLNIKSAFLHMMTDALVSLGVVIAGVLILVTGKNWIDPLVSLAVVVVVFAGTWGLLKDSLKLALDAVPEGIDLAEVRRYLQGLPGIVAVHDLHVWAMSTTETALTAHLVGDESCLTHDFYQETSQILHDRFGIEHATLQVEPNDVSLCRLSPDDKV
ncbi:MAG: cation transporter [Deltaproteobacteria bacterium]|nr:MAG: cation transporter [Deltaproteobacteria bacterium]